MPSGGWTDTDKACPKSGCDGVVFVKYLKNESGKTSHAALKCSKRGHFEKRGRAAEIDNFVAKLADAYDDED